MRIHKILVSFILFCLPLAAFPQPKRPFTFHYEFSVLGVTPGEKLQVWFPRARTDAFQQVRIVSITSDLPLKKTSDSKYGNSLFYAVAPKAAQAEYNFDVEYDVVRQERTTFPGAGVKPKL